MIKDNELKAHRNDRFKNTNENLEPNKKISLKKQILVQKDFVKMKMKNPKVDNETHSES